jgi:hypothetical protein
MGVELPHRVGDDVTRPEKISGAAPVYPEVARKARVQGVVIVEAIIDEQGDGTSTNVLKGLPLATQHYEEAAQLLDRGAASSADISLARCYLLLEQGRLKEAWAVAQSYRGPDQFELPYAVGLFASRKASAEKLLSPEARAEIIELGLQAETRAMAVRKDALAPVVYKGQLLGEKVKLTTDPQEQETLRAEIAQLMGLARELRVQGEIPDPFASETQ